MYCSYINDEIRKYKQFDVEATINDGVNNLNLVKSLIFMFKFIWLTIQVFIVLIKVIDRSNYIAK